MANCKVCNRNHKASQPCPLRVANALTMQPQALERLTDVDKKWMALHPVSVLAILEDELANRM